jgi:glycosyltransferase involved in cell wall biosynthesis
MNNIEKATGTSLDNRQMWTCAVLGAREYFLIPRAIFHNSQLRQLLTDAWIEPKRFLGKFSPGKRIAARFHDELAEANVQSSNYSALCFEFAAKAAHTVHRNEWRTILARNKWFDAFVTRQLLAASRQFSGQRQEIFFAYSYSATQAMAQAKKMGFCAVLGQIDGGPFEEELVLAEQRKYPALSNNFRAAPREYWARWREEIGVADRIIVNSNWAMKCLTNSGVQCTKTRIVPLQFIGQSAPGIRFPRDKMPRCFSEFRPLRVLFLGQVILRKGIGPLFEAIERLRDRPIEFLIVGPIGVLIPEELQKNRRVRLPGPIPRADVATYFQLADVFILPTISDGFALTQLEARSFGLPVIASKNCGEVIEHGIDGLLLEETSADEIVESLTAILKRPESLDEMSANIHTAPPSFASYAAQLNEAIL